nr:shikimate kinase [Hydrogenophaga crassostreae]
MPIALVGMPGSGKSTIGRLLARRCDFEFFDSDAVIEKAEGYSVRELFERLGEERFRELEALTIDRLTALPNRVISTGGGVVISSSNRDILKTRCHCIYLRSTPEELFRRLKNDRKRPLLQVRDPLEALKQLFLIRDPLYTATANSIVETGHPSVSSLVNTISLQLNKIGLGPKRHLA